MIEDLDVKKSFRSHINKLFQSEISLKFLLYEFFVYGTAYIVGGFFRDFLLGKPNRDIDIITDIGQNELVQIIKDSGNEYKINRHGGIKILFHSIQVDVWSFQENWAFKKSLVKLNENDTLNSIAKGCFYNYDALVINLHNYSYNLRYFNDFRSSNELKILQKSPVYQNINPTLEANILRAFYVKYKHGSCYSINTHNYLIKKVGHLIDRNNSSVLIRLQETRRKYPKYRELSDSIIEKYLADLRINDSPSNQMSMGL